MPKLLVHCPPLPREQRKQTEAHSRPPIGGQLACKRMRICGMARRGCSSELTRCVFRTDCSNWRCRWKHVCDMRNLQNWTAGGTAGYSSCIKAQKRNGVPKLDQTSNADITLDSYRALLPILLDLTVWPRKGAPQHRARLLTRLLSCKIHDGSVINK